MQIITNIQELQFFLSLTILFTIISLLLLPYFQLDWNDGHGS